ncbi:hypothetical protein CCP2SC5_1710004 [Azospirillaceae bacterium]
MIHDLINGFVLVIGGSMGFACFIVAYRLMKGDPIEYERNRQRTKSFSAALHGRLSPYFEGKRDYRVAAGLAIDRRTNTWVEQGRLSDEALASVFHDPNA